MLVRPNDRVETDRGGRRPDPLRLLAPGRAGAEPGGAARTVVARAPPPLGPRGAAAPGRAGPDRAVRPGAGTRPDRRLPHPLTHLPAPRPRRGAGAGPRDP